VPAFARRSGPLAQLRGHTVCHVFLERAPWLVRVLFVLGAGAARLRGNPLKLFMPLLGTGAWAGLLSCRLTPLYLPPSLLEMSRSVLRVRVLPAPAELGAAAWYRAELVR
jgi:hypothetical protein